MDFHGLPVQDIRSQLPRNRTPGHGPNQTRPLSAITGIAVHWDAEYRPHAYKSLDRYIGQANYHIKKDWSSNGSGAYGDGLMYHFRIDNTGIIFWTRGLEEVVWAVSAANYNYVSICLDCGMDNQLKQQPPTREQAQALQKLLDELCFKHPEFPAGQQDVKGHGEIPTNSTNCPGSLLPMVHSYRAERNTHPENYQYDYPPRFVG